MVMPAFYHTGIRCGHIQLPELDELLIVAAQNFHQPAALVRNHFQLLDAHALDHDFTLASCDLTAAFAAPTLFAPPLATRLLARSSDSKVPASVHQPSITLWRNWPSARY